MAQRALRWVIWIVAIAALVGIAARLAAGCDAEFAQFLDAAYRRHTDFEASLDQLRTFDREALSVADRLSYDLFAWYLEDQAFARSVFLGTVSLEEVPYERWLRHYTTTSLSPSDLYALLSDEVARNGAQVRSLFAVLGLEEDSMAARWAAVDRLGIEKTVDQGRAVSDVMQEHIDAAGEALRPHFGLYPTDPVIVTPVPGILSIASLRMGSAAQRRPNQVQILPGRDGVPYFLRWTVTHHEAFPGHYVQESVQRLLTHLPAFRTQGGFAAYTEAWALYGEQLAWDVGLFEGEDPLYALGFFHSKARRAATALADVGIHAMGWSLDRAHALLVEAVGLDLSEAQDIVARLLQSPGAATASYAGYLSFVALREKAERALGETFRLVDYHRWVLEEGPMPMEILGREVDRHLAARAP